MSVLIENQSEPATNGVESMFAEVLAEVMRVERVSVDSRFCQAGADASAGAADADQRARVHPLRSAASPVLPRVLVPWCACRRRGLPVDSGGITRRTELPAAGRVQRPGFSRGVRR